MNNKEVYKAFCEKEKSIPLFLQFDWLNTVANKKWNVVFEKRGDQIVGVFPYVLNKRKGLKLLELPALTPIGGPWVKYPEQQKYTNRLSYEKDVLTNLIQKLPPFDSFVIKFHPSITNWLPFFWKNYSQQTRYTYLLEDLKDLNYIFSQFRENIKREIRKAEKTIHITQASSAKILYDLKDKSLKKENQKINITFDYLDNIFNLCKRNLCGEILIATEDDKIHSAGLFVWDNNMCYYLYGASNPDYKNSGAMSLLLWTAIKEYSKRTQQFNFEGSMIENIERFFRGFGAKQVPYFQIQKTNSKLLKIKSFLNNW